MIRRRKPTFSFLLGINSGLPVVIGYFPIAITFGLLASEYLTPIHTIFMSALVFAGASQFMALQLIAAHSRMVEIIIVTFLMNFRHFLMSASLSQRLKNTQMTMTPFIAFGLTDETFAVAMTDTAEINHRYMLGLEIVAYSSWVSGTALGYIIGSFIPHLLQESMYIALYALFTALLIPHLKKSLPVVFIAAIAAGANTLLQGLDLIKPGWSLIIAIVFSSSVGALIFRSSEENR